MCGRNLTMKVPLDFHNYQELNGLLNSFSNFTIAPPNLSIYATNLADLQKGRKNNILLEVAATKCSPKTPPWKFHKIYREIPVLDCSFWRSRHPEGFCKKEVLDNIEKFKGKHLCQSLFLIKLQASGVSCEFLFKRDCRTGVSEPAVCRSSTK